MKISACPKCGSKNISMGTMDSGVTFGVTSWKEICRDCNYQGRPLVFDSEKEYKKFLEGIKQKPQDKKTKPKKKSSVEEKVDEIINISEKDRETVELLREYEKEKVSKPIWPKNKVWWPEIGLAFAISVIFIILLIPQMISLFGVGFGIIYSLLILITSFLSVLASIVAIEYFLKMTKNAIVR